MSKRRKSTGLNIVYFDLETSGLQADFGVVLCMAFAVNDGPVQIISQRGLNPDFGNRRYSNDRGLLIGAREILTQADILVAHNGQYFDLPFLRTRLAVWGLPQLEIRPVVDPCLCSRRKFRFARNDLAGLAARFALGHKSDVDYRVWQRATLDGDLPSWEAIEAHCIQDVRLLRKLAAKFRGLVRSFDVCDRA